MKTRRLGAEMFHANGRTDEQACRKLIVDFRNFANGPKKCTVLHKTLFHRSKGQHLNGLFIWGTR
jgi:hypothetical protein